MDGCMNKIVNQFKYLTGDCSIILKFLQNYVFSFSSRNVSIKLRYITLPRSIECVKK